MSTDKPKPGTFFKGTTLLPLALADYIKKDLGIGPDGSFWTYQKGVWSPEPDVVRARMVQVLKNRYHARFVSTVEDTIKHSYVLPQIPASPIEEKKWNPTINLKNGVYNWNTGMLEKHKPENLHTVQLPFKFDVEAKCPNFDAWVSEVVSPDIEQMFWEVLGYMLMSGNPLQRAFLLHGPEGTGKSTFQRVLEEMLGKWNISSVSLRDLTEDRFAGSQLFGKIANILGDLDASYLENSSTFKRITGGDLISAQRKYKDAFDFRNWATPMFSANKVWRSADDTGGYFRRWVVLPFTHKVDRTKDFDETKLYREAPGIFNKAMGALQLLKLRGDFELFGDALLAKQEFEQDSDPLRLWLAEDDNVTADPTNTSLKSERTPVYERYKFWTENVNHGKAKTASEFYKAMEAQGYAAVKVRGVRCLVGITVYDTEAYGLAAFTEEKVAA